MLCLREKFFPWDLHSQNSLTCLRHSVVRNNRISMTATDQWFPTRDDVIARGHVAVSGDNSDCCSWGPVLASSGWRPGMVLNILRCVGQPPTAECYPTPNVNGPKVEKPWQTNQSFALQSGGEGFCSTKAQSLRGCVGVVAPTKRAHYNCDPLTKLVSWAPQKGRLRTMALTITKN